MGKNSLIRIEILKKDKFLYKFRQVYRTPWRFWYSNSQVFRWFSRIMLSAFALTLYLPLKGVDLSYTPYTIVHHQLDHKFGDWIEEMRYPVDQKRVEEYKKAHGLK